MNADQIRAYIDPIRHEFADQRSLVLPALKYAQTESGHLTREDMEAVAEATGYSPSYVESVASFYDRLYTDPVGDRVVSVCITLSCMLRGSDQVWDRLCEQEGVDHHHGGTSADGRITIQEAQCLGYCDRAPCIQVDAEETEGPFTPDEAAERVARLRTEPSPTEYWR
ncbi:MAG: NAD(P)H-dependent oxidoreductase subunit E [Thermoleophilia bacterium]